MQSTATNVLKTYGLRNTQPRRLVLDILKKSRKALSHKSIHTKIQSQQSDIDLVTVYRILEKFEEVGLLHRHPSSGNVTLCTLDEKKCHHILLSCDACGIVDECTDSALCSRENSIAQDHGFTSKRHLSEIIGICSSCS